MSGLPLSGAVTVVTGASSGIGAATAVAASRRGARVVVVARREDRLTATVSACHGAGGQAVSVCADVTDPDAADEIVAVAAKHFGPVDVVVNNAGTGLHKPAIETSLAEAERIFAIHVFAPMRLAAAVLPSMLDRRRGAIVNITSTSAGFPTPDEAVYGAAKAALARWTHGLANELVGTGVHASVVSPGPIETEIWQHVGPHYRGRLFPPDVVADAVVTAVERGRTHISAPRRFGVPAALYPLAGAAMRYGARRYATRR